jgi:CubicO group peptidase (beta-lactamase class C family)
MPFVQLWATMPLLLLLISAATSANPDRDCERQAQQTAIQLDALRMDGQVPAMGLSIFCDGQALITAGYGNADADTPFRWGSITKSVTGLAALRLVQTTDVSLASPIRPILGAGYYRNPWADSQPVRLGHLLALSAGLPDLTRNEWNDNEPRPLWQALQRHQDARTLLWPPGLQHSYSNVPPGLAAAVIERVSQQSFEAYLEQHVFVPLGMREATLSPIRGLPGGFQADGRAEIPYWHMTFQAFGALNASTREMTYLLTALLNDGRLAAGQILEPDLVATFFRPMATLADDAGLEVGYGAGVYGWVRDGHLFHGHGGDADGYRSRYGLLRDHGRGYLVVINTDNPGLLGRMRRVLEEALIEGLPAASAPAQASIEPEALDALAGDYYPASARFDRGDWQSGERARVRVRRSGRHLQLERAGRTTPLFPADEARFYRAGDPAITTVFIRDQHGSLHLQGETGNFVRISPGPCPDFLPFCD